MPKIPQVDRYDTSRIHGATLLPSAVEVEGESDQPVILLKVVHPGAALNLDGKTTIVLSPPGAARLARDLQEAVENYLYGETKENEGG